MTSQDTHHEVSRVDRIDTNAILKFQERTNDLQATAKLNDGIEQFLVGVVFVARFEQSSSQKTKYSPKEPSGLTTL